MSSMDAVRLLGRHVDQQWSDADYSEEAFPEIALAAVREARLHEALTLETIAEWALSVADVPVQADRLGRFGQPSLTLYRGRRFYVSALFWLDGTTSIHQHGFSGAFQVLAGSSIHTDYEFETTRVVSPHMKVGRLESRAVRLLKAGDALPIVSAERYIHSLFHLDHPSVSLVVRTETDAGAHPQWDYIPPGIAVDPETQDDFSLVRVRLTELLRELSHASYEKLVGDAVASSDAHTAFCILQAAARHPDRRTLSALLSRARSRHGALVDTFDAALEEDRAMHFILARRTNVTVAEHRFFLALLLNLRRRADILRLTAEHVPGAEPSATIVRWLSELTNVTMKLQLAGTTWEPNVLGLPQLDSAALASLRAHLEAPLDSAQEDLPPILRRIRDIPAFASLFR